MCAYSECWLMCVESNVTYTTNRMIIRYVEKPESVAKHFFFKLNILMSSVVGEK